MQTQDMHQDSHYDVSIIIVNWNTRDLLAACLESVVRSHNSAGKQDLQHIPASGVLSLEVIVVDNASADGSAEMVKMRFPYAILIENAQNEGFARANNLAIRRACGRYILLLNSDAELVPGILSSMVSFLDQNPTVGITSVRVAFPDGHPQFCHGYFPTLRREFLSLFGLHRWDMSLWDRLDQPQQVDWVSGACLMARRVMLDQIGLLDERFFMFAEEVDLCYRADCAGWGVYLVPSPPLLHVNAGSTGKTPSRIMRLYRGKVLYARKHGGPLRSAAIELMIYVSAISKTVAYLLGALLLPSLHQQHSLWLQVMQHLLRGELRHAR